MREKVKTVIEDMRQYLRMDGGDVELVDVDENTGEVKVKLKGACGCCPMAQITLSQGIEARLKEKIPEVKKVTAV